MFARLLDPDGGHWCICPADAVITVERIYLDDTLVLRTVFRTAAGCVSVTDARAFAPDARGHAIGKIAPHVLLRRVAGLSGMVEIELECAPRLDYGRIAPHVTATSSGAVLSAGAIELQLLTQTPLQCLNEIDPLSWLLRTSRE